MPYREQLIKTSQSNPKNWIAIKNTRKERKLKENNFKRAQKRAKDESRLILNWLYENYSGQGTSELEGTLYDRGLYSTEELVGYTQTYLAKQGWLITSCLINNMKYKITVIPDPEYKPGIIERIKAWITMKLFL